MMAAALGLFGMLTSSAAPAKSDDEQWTTWHNARFAYEICYPAAVFPENRESPQGHGIVMESSDSAQLIAAAVRYPRETLAEPIRMERERLTHISLVARGENWFVVSGTRVDQILYTKAILVEGRLVAFRFRYPESLAAKYAPIVERISDCLQVSHLPS